MKLPELTRCLRFALPLLATCAVAGAAQLRLHADDYAQGLEQAGRLAPVSGDIAELRFADLFKLPAGPRGLEVTDKVRALDGHRVRILGFMVKQAKPLPGMLLLSPFEITTNEVEYGIADDLPPSLVHVQVPAYEDLGVPFTPGPLLLTGVLEVGPRIEADGRGSMFRLRLDEKDEARPLSPPSPDGISSPANNIVINQ